MNKSLAPLTQVCHDDGMEATTENTTNCDNCDEVVAYIVDYMRHQWCRECGHRVWAPR